MKEKTINRLDVDIKLVKKIVAQSSNDYDSNLIAILQQTQDEYGFLPKPVLREISRLTDIPLTRIFGVCTFYSQFSFVPKGKFTIKVCIGTACHVRGAEDVKTSIKQLLNVGEGETTSDYRFTLESVACLGVCALGPVVVVGNSKKSASCCDGPEGKPERDKSYGQVSPAKVEGIIENYAEEEL